MVISVKGQPKYLQYLTPAEIEEKRLECMQRIEEAKRALAGISRERLLSVRDPGSVLCARRKCFDLFIQGLKPRDITRKASGGIKRQTLYRYYGDYQILRWIGIIKANTQTLQSLPHESLRNY